jgi:TPR repeat protein
MCYKHGWGCEKDESKAEENFLKAANLGKTAMSNKKKKKQKVFF